MLLDVHQNSSLSMNSSTVTNLRTPCCSLSVSRLLNVGLAPKNAALGNCWPVTFAQFQLRWLVGSQHFTLATKTVFALMQKSCAYTQKFSPGHKFVVVGTFILQKDGVPLLKFLAWTLLKFWASIKTDSCRSALIWDNTNAQMKPPNFIFWHHFHRHQLILLCFFCSSADLCNSVEE